MFVPIFHLFVVVLNSFTLWYDQNYVKLPLPKELDVYSDIPFKLRYMFLTIWCLVIQTLYFSLAFLNDLIGSNEAYPKKISIVRSLKDIIYSLAFPLAFYVAITFWTIYILYKDLIFPDYIENVFPVWVNHVAHTLIVPFVVIELIATPKKYPSKRVGITFSLFVVFCYLSLLGAAFVQGGTMVYPLLNAMSWTVKLSFVCCSIALGLSVYVLGEKLNSVIHYGGSSKVKSQKVKRKAQ